MNDELAFKENQTPFNVNPLIIQYNNVIYVQRKLCIRLTL